MVTSPLMASIATLALNCELHFFFAIATFPFIVFLLAYTVKANNANCTERVPLQCPQAGISSLARYVSSLSIEMLRLNEIWFPVSQVSGK